MKKIEYHPIGVVHSPFTVPHGIPRQSYLAKGVRATVEIFPEFQEGLQDLERFSHILLLCHFHGFTDYDLHAHPPGETSSRGLFSTRSPRRPNPIGLSIVRLEGITDNILSIAEIDMIDGTPVLDIKPYVGEYGKITGVRTGWLETAKVPL